MGKYCSNCGSELNETQDICLKCGVLLKKDISVPKKKKHSSYIKTSSIIMIIIGACMILGANANSYMYDNIVVVFILPGILAVISGILALNSKKNRKYLLYSGAFYIIGAVVNFIGIIDISFYMILAVIFGIFNIIYSKDANN